ncbi:MAG TPA: F0F1 ATP synthase subunit A [Halanaerobiales bacterium]|nr:F0F1 ATP synthase subunit A [Halanaerobiales bacterium]
MNPGPQVVTHLFGKDFLPVTDTLIVSWVVVVALVIAAKIIGSNLELVPGKVQNATELLLTSIEDQIEPMLPGEGRKFLPFIGTIFIFVGVSNLSGVLPGVPNPTADINTTLGLALLVFILMHFEGMRENGIWGYIKGFAEPVFILLPLNIISELAKPISHSFRLFGNIVGGGIIITLIYQAAPWLIPIPLQAWFDIFIGLIQALIFGMVAIAYIAVSKEG